MPYSASPGTASRLAKTLPPAMASTASAAAIPTVTTRRARLDVSGRAAGRLGRACLRRRRGRTARLRSGSASTVVPASSRGCSASAASAAVGTARSGVGATPSTGAGATTGSTSVGAPSEPFSCGRPTAMPPPSDGGPSTASAPMTRARMRALASALGENPGPSARSMPAISRSRARSGSSAGVRGGRPSSTASANRSSAPQMGSPWSGMLAVLTAYQLRTKPDALAPGPIDVHRHNDRHRREIRAPDRSPHRVVHSPQA